MVCTVRLYALERTSFSSSAKIIGIGKPTAMDATLIITVFFSSLRK